MMLRLSTTCFPDKHRTFKKDSKPKQKTRQSQARHHITALSTESFFLRGRGIRAGFRLIHKGPSQEVLMEGMSIKMLPYQIGYWDGAELY